MTDVLFQEVLLPDGTKTLIDRQPLPLPPLRCPLRPPPREPAKEPAPSAPSRRWTVREFFERHYLFEAEKCKKPGIHKNHRQALDKLRTFCGEDPELSWITRRRLRSFRRWLRKNCRAASTANRHLRNILAVLREAVDENVCRPFGRKIRLLTETRKPARSWRMDELEKMLATVQNLAGHVGDVPASRWWRALVLVLYDTGLRISATMALRWTDHKENADGVFFAVRGETQKGGKSRCPGISQQTAEALAAIAGERELVFFWPWDPPDENGQRNWVTLRAHLRRDILGPAGVDAAGRQLLHAFRKTSATQVKKAGGNASEQLGHSSPAVTERYIDPEELGASRECDRLPRPGLPASRQRNLF